MEMKFRNLAVAAVAVGFLLPTLANAQDIFLSNTAAADQTWKGTAPNANAGVWMDLGNVSNDGRRDLIVGAPGTTAGSAGAVYVIFGGPSRTGELSLANAETVITSSELGNRFGFSTASGNIRNAEDSGPRNLVVGAPGALGGRGAVYLFDGGFATGARLNTTSAAVVVVGQAGDQFGSALATGDLDNDGFRELIVGAPGNGRVYVIKGGPSLSGTIDLAGGGAAQVITAPGIGRVLTAGDVTGDGIYDLLIGSPSQNFAFLFRGGALPLGVPSSLNGVDAGDEAGASLRILDIDSDGKDDLAIGAPGGDGPAGDRLNAGEVYVFRGPLGSGAISLASASIVFYGAAAGHRAGETLAAGDINRDAPNDLVIHASGGAGGAGELDIYYGRKATSIGVLVGTQRRVDMSVAGQVSRHIYGDPGSGPIKSAQAFEVTGEGARDIIVGVPAMEGGAGKLFFTISPKLRISPTTLSLTVGQGVVTSTTPINVLNRSIVAIGWQISSNVSWLSGAPAAGTIDQTHPNSFAISASGAGLAAGTYTGKINVSANSPDLEMTLPVNVTLTVTTGPGPNDPPPGGGPTPGPNTRISLSRTGLFFGATNNGTVKTGAQKVTVNFTNGSGSWSATTTAPWLTLAPTSGIGSGSFTATVKNGTYPNGSVLNGTITVTAPGVPNSPLSIPVQLKAIGRPGNPTGQVDTPANNVRGVTGAIPVTGWAVDDIGVTQVTLWRDPMPGEIAGANGVFIGNAVPVEGARPDVDATFSLPYDYQAGWGYLLLTNMLPNQGNGTFRLLLFADDVEGHRVLLGTRTITCDNAHATKPFGSIDTPSQGGTASGATYANFGWALTPMPNSIPTDGSTITVFVDGVPLGHPVYNNPRSDIQTLFPGRANTNGAIGLFNLNTTKLANGVHTIAWGVTDSAGNSEGIGSRYFTVLNGTSASVLSTEEVSPSAVVMKLPREGAAASGSAVGQQAVALETAPVTPVPTYVRSGFDPSAPLEIVETRDTGASHLKTQELGLLRVTLGSPVTGADDQYEGYLLKGSRLAPLPSGSFLDRRSGEFFWQPGLGFVGTYELVFVRNVAGASERIPLTVEIAPRRQDGNLLLPSRTIRY